MILVDAAQMANVDVVLRHASAVVEPKPAVVIPQHVSVVTAAAAAAVTDC